MKLGVSAMVRPYAVKGRKHKKRKMEQREEAVEEEVARGGEEEEEEVAAGNEKKVDAVLDELPGIPSVAPVEKSKQPNVIFILEKASLEIGKVGKVRKVAPFSRFLRDYLGFGDQGLINWGVYLRIYSSIEMVKVVIV